MRRHIHNLGFLMVFAPAVAAAGVNLDASIETLSVADRVADMLNFGEAQPVTVRRLITMDWWTLEHTKAIPRGTFAELATLVRGLGLELYLTGDEVAHFARTGVVPPPSVSSRTDRLALNFGARSSLRRVGVALIGEVGTVTRKRFLSSATPPRTIKEIAAAVAPFGIIIWANEGERAAGARGRLDPALHPLEGLGLSPVVVRLLHQENLWNVPELKDRDRTSDLRLIDHLGPGSLGAIASVLRGHGHVVSWNQKVEQMDFPESLVTELRERGLATRNDLRLFLEKGERGRVKAADLRLIKAVRAAQMRPSCAARMDGTLPSSDLEVVDVE